ncbi:MAG: FAD-dependent oxidoreductase [Oscillatoria sp. Prado101]|jgi:pyruvate/2-oxoglutarate dehydrogenase complex dihydrolipoamide dehydrogenase (E3) component|nr:FAD-dependent oxidoreductase [Oscillatoria sp. Prado101]
MAVDYDLAIIGSSRAGLYAAAAAASLKARVALVTLSGPGSAGFEESYRGLCSKALTEVSSVAQRLAHAHQEGIHSTELENAPAPEEISLKFSEALQWAAGVATNLGEMHSPAVLASLGVDVIASAGQFYPKPHLGFEVKDRRIRARTYLLATGSKPAVPEIEGLSTTGYLTGETLGQLAKSKQVPQSLIVIGGAPTGIELAQTFARLGSSVTLVVKSPRILPHEDPEAALLVQAQLEAEGVRVLTNTEATQVRRIEGKKWVQAGNLALEGDEILLAAGQMLDVASLNLESVGVKFHRRGLELNQKLQTTNPRIYACGDALGGEAQPHVAQYEAGVALKNALFLPVFKVDYHGIPRAIFTDPQVARVGLTEAQATSRYGRDVLLLRQYLKTVAKAQLRGETTGFCKIAVRRNGEILGATVVGGDAGELIHSIALALRQKIKIGAIADMPHIWPTLSEIAGTTAAEWRRLRFAGNPRLQDFLKGWFNWRRGW